MRRMLKLFSMLSCLLQSLLNLVLPNELIESPLRERVWKSDVWSISEIPPDEG